MSVIRNHNAWIDRAEEDLIIARYSLKHKPQLIYPACFHAQQCAEKYLKAILIAKDLSFPKTHDLLMLSSLCKEAGIELPFADRDLNTLNDYSIRVRYPGDTPTLEDAHEAVLIAENVRAIGRKYFNL